MKMPSASTTRSPSALISRPQNGLDDQPHQGEDRDHCADREVADPETPREHRQHGDQDAEAHGDAECDHAEHEYLAWHPGGAAPAKPARLRTRGIHGHSLPAAWPAVTPREAGKCGLRWEPAAEQKQEAAVAVFGDIRAWLAARRTVRSRLPFLSTTRPDSPVVTAAEPRQPARSDREPGTSETEQASREAEPSDAEQDRAGPVD